MGVEADDPGNEYNWTHTLNGCYELTYWRVGIELAQRWRERRGLARNAEWSSVQESLCRPLPRHWSNGTASAVVYFFDDGSKALVGGATALGQVYACGHLPCTEHMVDARIMRDTIHIAGDTIGFENGYPSDNFDYAMAAARLGEADFAMDILMTTSKANRFNPKNGYWQGFFPAFTPTNGQLLYAVAMLVGGWDAADANRTSPGLPASGWRVKSEGFTKMF